MKCYVVYKEDRGSGILIEGVYFSEVLAQQHAARSSHTYCQQSPVEDARQDIKEAANTSTNSDYAVAQRVWEEWRLSKESDSCSFVRYFQERLNAGK